MKSLRVQLDIHKILKQIDVDLTQAAEMLDFLQRQEEVTSEATAKW